MNLDLATTYMGLELANPLVASSSPMCDKVARLQRLEEAGIAAVVLPSLFEEQFDLESWSLHESLMAGTDSYAEALSYLPELPACPLGPHRYLNAVESARAALSIPVIASLNGASPTGWVRFAKDAESAGASALELNVYYIPANPDMPSSAVEQRYVDLVALVRSAVKIPLAVKVGPWFSSPGHLFRRLSDAGANAIVLFNRFYQPEFDLEKLEVVPTITLSTPEELRMRLRWVAMLHGRIGADLAITGGVHRGRDVLGCMMAGARVAMMASALLQHGPGHVTTILSDIREWMGENEYQSIRQMQGCLSQQVCPDPAAFERANYLKVLGAYTLSG
ncbi:dihydroorotate dehydrogenase-like protein [bacterium]|nr:dihydroorotate dehydrogenase-like protein [bacterium]